MLFVTYTVHVTFLGILPNDEALIQMEKFELKLQRKTSLLYNIVSTVNFLCVLIGHGYDAEGFV